MAGTSETFGVLDGVSARTTLTHDRVTIVTDDGSGEFAIPINDLVDVLVEWPAQTEDYVEPGYIQFVRRGDSMIGGAFDEVRALPNVMELDDSQMRSATAFSKRVTKMLPRTDSPASSSAATRAPYRSTAPRPRIAPDPDTTPKDLSLTANGYLRTIAAGVFMLAIMTGFSAWYGIWYIIITVTEITDTPKGVIGLALLFASIATPASYLLAHVMVSLRRTE